MAGVPISAMPTQNTLSPTDKFPFSVGPLLGDNRAITWADLQLLLQTFGAVQQSVQTVNYANNNSTNVVILNHYVLLTEGKYLLTWNASVGAGGANADLSMFLVYNVNPLLTAYDVTDVTISGSIRNQRVPTTVSVCISTTGLELTVPAGLTYIVKLVIYEATGQSYTVQNRVLTALKTL